MQADPNSNPGPRNWGLGFVVGIAPASYMYMGPVPAQMVHVRQSRFPSLNARGEVTSHLSLQLHSNCNWPHAACATASANTGTAAVGEESVGHIAIGTIYIYR